MGETNSTYQDLTPGEKNKVRNCSKWNFYSQKCKTCQYEVICAKDWKMDDWFPLKNETENKKNKAEINDLITSLNILIETDSYSQYHSGQILTILKEAINKILDIIST